jgi:phage gpG-like protein
MAKRKTPVEFAMQVRGARGRFARATPSTVRLTRELFAKDVQSNFDGSHTPDGKAWPPITHRPGKPLVLTGRLMQASVRAAGKAQLEGGKIVARLASSAVRYGKYHQFGTKRIKQRRFFGMSKSSAKQIAKHVAKLASRSFRGK